MSGLSPNTGTTRSASEWKYTAVTVCILMEPLLSRPELDINDMHSEHISVRL